MRVIHHHHLRPSHTKRTKNANEELPQLKIKPNFVTKQIVHKTVNESVKEIMNAGGQHTPVSRRAIGSETEISVIVTVTATVTATIIVMHAIETETETEAAHLHALASCVTVIAMDLITIVQDEFTLPRDPHHVCRAPVTHAVTEDDDLVLLLAHARLRGDAGLALHGPGELLMGIDISLVLVAEEGVGVGVQ